MRVYFIEADEHSRRQRLTKLVKHARQLKIKARTSPDTGSFIVPVAGVGNRKVKFNKDSMKSARIRDIAKVYRKKPQVNGMSLAMRADWPRLKRMGLVWHG